MNLIDRQAAIDFIDAGRLVNPNEPRWSDNEVVNFLKSRPSAQPERKTGRWIKDRRASLNGGSYEVFVCSECESAFNWRMRYCGHCGAKMEGEDNAT